jgi:hypothetical protein
MRVMVQVKASPETEAGVLPTEAEFAEMGAFNAELTKAGVLVEGDGLKPSSAGARVRFSGAERTVVHGPFPLEGLVAGYWIWEVASLEEAITWARRCPNPTGFTSELEIRPFYTSEDFGEAFTPELQAQEDRIRNEVAARLDG